MKIPSASQHLFSRVPSADIPRSTFDRSHGVKTTFEAGLLTPIYVDEVVPGDTFNLNYTGFGRLATPLHPVMDNMYLDTFFFFIPNRLLWDNWEKFNGAQDNPGDSIDYLVPTMTSPAGTGYLNGTLHDYFGIPTAIPDLEHSSLWHRAYNLVYNSWFRDQNLQNSVTVDTDDGPDDPADYVILRRGKRHDYFTSCLPWAQKGDAVTLPFGDTAPIQADGQLTLAASGGAGRALTQTSGSTAIAWGAGATATGNALYDGGLEADLSTATAITINQFRESFQIQKLLERDARGGTRYTELIRAHFGVVSPDARLQRPEYLGGGSTRVNITPVAQTSETNTTAQGNLAGFGTASMTGQGFTKSFTEHGVLLGLICLRADLNYQQGLNRMFSRSDRYDFYLPALAHLGEQAVLNKEIYAQGTSADDNVFGYQERWAEMRYKPNVITGQFRSNFTTSLDTWHLAQDFSTLPSLNANFIVENPPVDRVIAVPSEPHMILDSLITLKCARPMPVYSVPGLIDHF